MSKKKSKLQDQELDPEIIDKAKAEVDGITDVQILKDKRDEYNERTKFIVQERKRVDEEFKLNRDRANDYKTKRDELNNQVKELKDEKKKYYEQLNELNDKLREIKQKESDSDEKKDNNRGKSMANLKKITSQIKALEKKIITEDIGIKEENEIISEIQKLEQQKVDLEGVTGKSKESKKVFKEVTAIKKQIDDINAQIQDISQESQNCHVLMLELYKENDTLKKDLDKLRKDLIESKIIADEYHNKYRELNQKARQRKQFKGSSAKVQKQLKKQIAEDTLKDALDKKKKGQKLNIFEARALFENAVQGQDQDEK